MASNKVMADLGINIYAQTAQLKKGLAQANKSINGFQRQIAKIGPMLGTAFGGAALIAGISATIKKIAEFENTMKRVAIISKGNQQELSALALTLGKETVFTANEAGKAMTFLAQAGFESNEILKATPGILNLAASAQLDLANAADIASNILSGFGLAAEEINRVNDILVTTTNSANLNVEQMGESFKMVAPIAKSAGISINKAAGFVGVLGDAGIQGTMAGTQLKGAIAALINPTAKGTAVLKKLGVQVSYNADGGLNLTKTFEDLKNAGITTKDAFQLFNKISATGALVMIDATEKAKELAKATHEVGVAAKQASEQQNTLQGDITKMGSAWDGVIMKGSAFNKVLRSLIQGTTNTVNAFSAFADANFNLLTLFDNLKMKILEVNGTVDDFHKSMDELGVGLGIKQEVTDPLLRRMLGLDDKKKKREPFVEPKEVKTISQMIQHLNKELAKTNDYSKAELDYMFLQKKELEEIVKKEKERQELLYQSQQLKAEGVLDNTTGVTDQLLSEEEITNRMMALKDMLLQKEKENAAELVRLNSEKIDWNNLIANSFQGMANVITNALNSTQNIFQAFGKFFVDFIKGLIVKFVAATVAALALVGVMSLIPGMGIKAGGGIAKGAKALSFGKQLIGGLKTVGGFANGGIPSGFAKVGERGTEMVAMPQGSRVISHADSVKALSSANGSASNIVVDDIIIQGEDLRIVLAEANRKHTNSL